MRKQDESESESSELESNAPDPFGSPPSARRTAVGQIVSKRGMAEILGLSLGQLDSLIRVGMPYESRGDGKIRGATSNAEWQFATARVIQWLRDGDKQQVHDLYDGDGDDDMLKRLHPEDPRYEERMTVTEIRKIELAEKRSRTLLIEDARNIIAEEYAIVRARLMAIAGRSVQEIVGAFGDPATAPLKVERILKTEISAALASLSADAERTAEEDSESESENDPGF